MEINIPGRAERLETPLCAALRGIRTQPNMNNEAGKRTGQPFQVTHGSAPLAAAVQQLTHHGSGHRFVRTLSVKFVFWVCRAPVLKCMGKC